MMNTGKNENHNQGDSAAKAGEDQGHNNINKAQRTVEIGGPKGPEPTRYGDWEKKGRCIDF